MGADASGSQESATRLEIEAVHALIKEGLFRPITPDQVSVTFLGLN